MNSFCSRAEGIMKKEMETEKRLGEIAEYDNPYISLQPAFEARQIRSFAKMALSGIFEGGI